MNTYPNTQSSILSKAPPQSIEAEESILSAVLLDSDTLMDIVEIISPEDFYKPAHVKIFSAINALLSLSQPIDIVTVSNQLNQEGKLEEIGGATYLSRLIDTVPLAVNAVYYARIIREKSILRRLIEQSSKIVQKCYEDQGDLDGIIDFAQSAVFEISDNKIKPSFSPVSELILDNINTIEERQNNNSEFSGTPTGYGQLDKLLSGLQKSDLIILAARPSMGKTAFALNIARNVAVNSQEFVAVFSLEMSKEQLSMRLLTAEARINSEKLKKGTINEDDWQRVTDAASLISDIPIYIDDSPNISPMDVRTKCRRLKMEHGLGLIIIDYLQLMKSSKSNDRRDLEIAEISRSLKGLAKELNVPIIALSQLNRMLEQRSEKRPLMSDLRESGSLEQDADIITFIYRDEVYNKDENNPNKGMAEIIVAKNRNGALGTAHLSFIGKYTRFENAAIGNYDHLG